MSAPRARGRVTTPATDFERKPVCSARPRTRPHVIGIEGRRTCLFRAPAGASADAWNVTMSGRSNAG